MFKQFSQKATSHIVLLLQIRWSLLLYAVIEDLMIPFAAYTAVESLCSLHWTGESPTIAPFCGDLCGGSRPQLTHGSLGPHESAPKLCIDRFLKGSRTWPIYRQTHYSICSSSMWCTLITGLNRTGPVRLRPVRATPTTSPLCSVNRPTAHAISPAAADCRCTQYGMVL